MRGQTVNMATARKMIVYSGLDRQRQPDLSVRRVLADTSDVRMHRNGIRFLVILVCASAAALRLVRCRAPPVSVSWRAFPSARRPRCRIARRCQPSLAGSWKLHWLCAGRPIAMAAATLPGSIAAASSGMSSAGTGLACLARWQSSSGRAAPSARRTCNRAIWCSSKPSGGPASHVGVVVSGDEFVHAPSSRGEVRVEHLAAPYWASRFVGARRLPQQ